MVLLENKPCHFYFCEIACLQTKFELSRWTLVLSVSIFSFWSQNELLQQMALLLNKQRHFDFCEKTCTHTKFRPSRLTLPLSGSIFTFRSLNKLPQQMALKKKNHDIPSGLVISTVWSSFISIGQSIVPLWYQKLWTAHNHIRTCTTLANAKKKKWMPFGHQK